MFTVIEQDAAPTTRWGFSVSAYREGKHCGSTIGGRYGVNQTTEDMVDTIKFFRDERGYTDIRWELYYFCDKCNGVGKVYTKREQKLPDWRRYGKTCTHCKGNGTIVTKHG
jgi:DnaJ-class molecular chaperone